MREILFRGKRVDNDEWVEGHLYRISEKSNPFILLRNRCTESHEVFSNTVGQYTGLTDKNGKKIFEGDIVKCRTTTYEIRGYITYSAEYVRYLCMAKWQTPYTMDERFEYEVIGNIYDNPELLEEEKK